MIGGGINGAGIAWELARKDYQVTLFDKGRAGAQTSSKTTKMIHGGIRYLEHLHFRLVRESLHERAWLLEQLPQLVKPIEILNSQVEPGQAASKSGQATPDLISFTVRVQVAGMPQAESGTARAS